MTLAAATLARAAGGVQAGAPGTRGRAERRRTAGRLANWAALAVLAVACVIACELRGYRIDWRHLSAMAIIVAVVVAMPTEGGHYLVDMLAGAAITAAACLWLARRDRAALAAGPR